jgi:hypothetical protein
MISFFKKSSNYYFAVEHSKTLVKDDIKILSWLFGNASYSKNSILKGNYIGPVKEMTTPWSTNAVEITKNVGINYIERIEILEKNKNSFDPMTESKYLDPGQEIFKVTKKAEKVLFVDNLDHYNKNEGLALSDDEIDYLNQVSKRLNRKLTDSEVFGFSQVNSEHCRHKIFNGEFILDGKKMDNSLFQMIKKTSKENPSNIISAYKDNVILDNAHYGWDIPLIILAKNLKIPIIEYQHGYIGPDHIAYNFPEKFFDLLKIFLPDYFLSWGKYWSQNIKTPAKKFEIGHFYIWHTYKRFKNSKKQKVVLIASSGTMPQTYNNFVPKLKKLLPQYKFLFKPHPLEIPVAKTRYKTLEKEGVDIIIDTNVYTKLLPFVEIVISFERTTLLFESLLFGTKAILIDIKGLFNSLNLPFPIISESEMLSIVNIIQNIQTKQNFNVNINELWAPHPDRNFKRFLASLDIPLENT